LDGAITSPNEWTESPVYGISLDRVWGWPDRQVEPNNKSLNARFKNDGVWLYMLYQIPWSANETDLNDGAFIELFSSESDYGHLSFSNTTYDFYGWDGSRWLDDTQAGGQNNVEGAASYDGTYYWFEFRKMLDSGDGVDWSLTPGEYVDHLMVGIWDNSFPQTYEQSVSLQLALNSSTLVSCSPNPVSIGSPVTCTATVSGSNPTGTVTWSTSSSAGSFNQSVCTLSDGSCSTTYTDSSPGSVIIAASYGGDSNNVPSSGLFILAVTSGGPVYYSSNYTSVQAAIDAAPAGATVIVTPGFYSESLIVNKPLTIIGEKDPPIFSGGGSGIAITLLAGASRSIVTGIMMTAWDTAILVSDASGCKIYDNIMSLMKSNGVVLQGANAVNNQVYGNIFQQDAVAVDVTSSASNSTVSQNIVSLSTTGLKIETSGNTICANMISENQVGINITNSNDNVIFHNTFADNTVQASISNSAGNVWDDGYPSGGNYWSNHTGPDVQSGPNQDQPGSDGIVDTACTVAVGSVDRYPLVHGAHDVWITGVSTSKTVVGRGYTLHVEVRILNCGVYDENCPVAVYVNTFAAATQSVALTKESFMIVALAWNTSGFAYGNYTVSVYSRPVLGELNTANNLYFDGRVVIAIPGDIKGDGVVDIYDAIMLAGAYNSKSGDSNWNANADINGDGMVDIYDAIILAGNYGKTA
jgi:parallel beta-helix repeat protein